MKKINYKELIIYLIGVIVLSFGLCLNTKLDLGTSALMALPVAISNIYNIKLGDATFIYQLVFILIQVVIHLIMKKKLSIIGDILQLITSFVFSYLLNLYSLFLPSFSGLDNIFGNIYIRILILFITIIIIGVGASLMLKTKYPPNPSDGIVKTVSEFSKKDMGGVKNAIDISLVVITAIFSYLTSKQIIGIGIGTIVAMLGVGRVIHFFDKYYGKKIENFIK